MRRATEKFANYWMHNGFLNIDNKKMSKSAGNFFTVREIGEKYPLQVIRFFMLSAHYRSPLNFSDTLVEAAKHGLERILTAVDNLRDVLAAKQSGEKQKAQRKQIRRTWKRRKLWLLNSRRPWKMTLIRRTPLRLSLNW